MFDELVSHPSQAQSLLVIRVRKQKHERGPPAIFPRGTEPPSYHCVDRQWD